MQFKQYKRKGLSEMISITEFIENGGNLSKVSISSPDHLLQSHNPDEFNLGYVARNPKNHEDLWYVAKKYFDENLELAEVLTEEKTKAMEMFHGGCEGCTMQDKNGISYCVGCQYFDADWSLPNLNDSYISRQERLNKVRAEAILLKESGEIK